MHTSSFSAVPFSYVCRHTHRRSATLRCYPVNLLARKLTRQNIALLRQLHPFLPNHQITIRLDSAPPPVSPLLASTVPFASLRLLSASAASYKYIPR
jgi:hypothetical protein